MAKVVGVRFRNVGKIYYFNPKTYKIKVGDHVIVVDRHEVWSMARLCLHQEISKKKMWCIP